MSEASDVASPKKILIVRLGAMGDVIHAIPAVASLKTLFPRVHIGWIIEQRWSDLLRFRSLVDAIHCVDTRRWRKHLLSRGTIREAKAALTGIRAECYDVVLDLQGALKSSLIALLSGAPARYGFAETWEKPASLFYTHAHHVHRRHVVERNVELVLSSAKAEPGNEAMSGWTPLLTNDEGQQWASHKVSELGLSEYFVILNPGAGWGAKQWPAERYGEVARSLGTLGFRSLVNYGPGEEALARQIEQGSEGQAVSASFTISELMAITSRAALFIGGDTGPMHLAALMKVPVVGIFGPTDPARTGPYGTRSIVLRDRASVTSHKRYRETEPGLKNITTAQVLSAALELLQGTNAGARL